MMLARLGRIAILLAVLLAQQTALGHQLSHAAGVPQDQSSLCDLHDLLGTVLGVAEAKATTHVVAASAAAPLQSFTSVVAGSAVTTPKSRGPPAIS